MGNRTLYWCGYKNPYALVSNHDHFALCNMATGF